MKKGLLLSIVASTVLFAGGDIAPVQPVAEAPAAACNDFYGAVVAGVVYDSSKVAPAADVMFRTGAVLGVSKELFGGLVANAEVQGATGIDYTTSTSTLNTAVSAAGLSALNLAYSFGNTAIMVGRWAGGGSNVGYFGLKTTAHEGIKIANTDIADTSISVAYSHYSVAIATGARTLEKKISAEVVNKSFADTALTFGGSYELVGSTWDAYAAVDTKVMGADLSLGGKYFSTADYVAGATIQKGFDAVTLKLGASYSTGKGWSKYTDFTNGAYAGIAIGASAKTTFSGIDFKVAGDYQVTGGAWRAGVGIAKKISGVNYAADYRRTSGGANRVRVKAVYKF